MKTIATLAAGALALAGINSTLRADTFGAGPNTFTVDFVNIGNPGNADDAGAGGGLYSSPYGGVAYGYRMGKFEISQEQVEKASTGGLVGMLPSPHTGAEPTSRNWLQAAAFVNWLNTTTGHQAAYNLTYSGSWSMTLWSSGDAWQTGGENRYRHKDAYYFLPSEDEWYKAAYHQNDGMTANYWDYATGSNSVPTQELTGGTIPGSAVFFDPVAIVNPGDPTDANLAGGLSAYGTMGQNGNLSEWTESDLAGVNGSANATRVTRGGAWNGPESYLRSSDRVIGDPNLDHFHGFRVASIPEPTTALLLFSSGVLFVLRRQRQMPKDRNG